MKKALLTALLLVPFFSQSSESDKIYLKVESPREADYINGCPAYPTIEEHLDILNEINPSDAQTTYSDYSYVNKVTVFENAYSCKYRYTFRRTWSRVGNTDQNEQFTYAESVGQFTQVPQCPPQRRSENDTEAQDHFIMWEHPTRSWLCYSPKKLAEVDSCGDTTDSIDNMLVSSDRGVSCMAKDDGSVCPVKSDGSITLNSTGQEVFFYKLDETRDSDACYYPQEKDGEQGDIPDIPEQPGQCSDFNGLNLCYENPLNVCNSQGTCPTGCGTLSANGQVGFVCVSKDTDGDGIPDYLDPDIDGDGIRNEDDPDKDGDGIDDAQRPQPDLIEISNLLGRIEINTRKTSQNTAPSGTGGSGSGGNTDDGTGDSGTVIGGGASGAEIGNQLKDKLTENSDVGRQGDLDEFKGIFDGLLEDIQTLLDDEKVDLTKTISESNVKSSFSQLEQYFRANCASANIAIPNTNASFDVCGTANKVRPYLWIIFAVLTALYCFYRVIDTARKT